MSGDIVIMREADLEYNPEDFQGMIAPILGGRTEFVMGSRFLRALMSVGHPGESEGTVRATRDWLLAVQPADFDVTVITTYPGTPYFDEAVETKPGVWTYTYSRTWDRLHSIQVDYAEVAEYYKGIPGEYTSYTYTDYLRPEELVRLRDWVECEVRTKLNIPYNLAAPAIRYEHSMGQGAIPSNILRTSSLSMKKEREFA